MNAPNFPIDYHKEERRRNIRMESKRQQAIETLGPNWVFHPENPDRPRKGHYNNLGILEARN